MAFTSSFNSIKIGDIYALYARITTTGSPEWRVLGQITRTSVGAHLQLRPEAELCRPIWDACALDVSSDEICRVTFGVPCATGGIEAVAMASVTSDVARAIRNLALGLPRVPARKMRASGCAPRAIRTNFPAWLCRAEDEKESARAARAEARSAHRAARAARIASQQHPTA
jgi:hypothetical protein